MKEKILVSLDGAQESLVTAWLLKKQGHQLRAVIFDISEVPEQKEKLRNCAQDYERKLGIPVQVMESAVEARELVEKESKLCIDRRFSFDPKTTFHQRFLFPKLLTMKDHFNFQKIATGHRVNLHHEPLHNKMMVARFDAKAEDESYLLVGLSQEQLLHFEFPIGSIPMSMVEKLAAELNLGVVGAEKLAKFELAYQASTQNADSLEDIESLTGSGLEEELSLDDGFNEAVVFGGDSDDSDSEVGNMGERVINEIWCENASWFSGQDLGFESKNCLMSWKKEVHPVPVTISQYEGNGLKVFFEQPLVGSAASIMNGDTVMWLEGQYVLGGARVLRCL